MRWEKSEQQTHKKFTQNEMENSSTVMKKEGYSGVIYIFHWKESQNEIFSAKSF